MFQKVVFLLTDVAFVSSSNLPLSACLVTLSLSLSPRPSLLPLMHALTHVHPASHLKINKAWAHTLHTRIGQNLIKVRPVSITAKNECEANGTMERWGASDSPLLAFLSVYFAMPSTPVTRHVLPQRGTRRSRGRPRITDPGALSREAQQKRRYRERLKQDPQLYREYQRRQNMYSKRHYYAKKKRLRPCEAEPPM